MQGRDATPYLERNRVGRDAIDAASALTDMGKYLFLERRLPVYDIAVAITKLDMCRSTLFLPKKNACNFILRKKYRLCQFLTNWLTPSFIVTWITFPMFCIIYTSLCWGIFVFAKV